VSKAKFVLGCFVFSFLSLIQNSGSKIKHNLLKGNGKRTEAKGTLLKKHDNKIIVWFLNKLVNSYPNFYTKLQVVSFDFKPGGQITYKWTVSRVGHFV
jgi:hypothetical protein